ncbi:hypothetical protein HJG40_12475 [Acidithiobacillus sp. ATCC 19703]|uniref:Uncharacterized protein n=2 Tax=Acidithiobacillus concretivorus TaxID=3063952 RepID=A0ABS5ZSC9_9PROT|nr:hypothetical protein [Acidithiobacillus concretivorus]
MQTKAALWAINLLEKTTMPKSKAFKLAAEQFGLSAASIKREVVARKGEEWLSARDERMMEKYRPQYAARNRRSGQLCRQLDKHLRNIIKEDI